MILIYIYMSVQVFFVRVELGPRVAAVAQVWGGGGGRILPSDRLVHPEFLFAFAFFFFLHRL